MIGTLAFGGGPAAFYLGERNVVADTGWLTPADLLTAIAFAFMRQGPVLILAPFVGNHVAGVAGGLAAACGVFLIPWFLAAGSSRLLRTATQRPWVRAFGRGAAPTVVASLVVSAFDVGRASFLGWPSVVIAGAAALATFRRNHPVLVLIAGAAIGTIVGLPSLLP